MKTDRSVRARSKTWCLPTALVLGAALLVSGCHRKPKSDEGAGASSASAAPTKPVVKRKALLWPGRAKTQPALDPKALDNLAAFPMENGSVANLTRPVNWAQDPDHDRSWRYGLHSWSFMWPLLDAVEHGGQKPLGTAALLALDWLDHNPVDAKGTSEFAWYDMAVGLRAVALVYLTKHCEMPGSPCKKDAKALRAGAQAHADWLQRQENYRPEHNHGLYEDLGLLTLCVQLSSLRGCEEGNKLARKRFAQNARTTIEMREGVHLEHSPAYQLSVLYVLRDFAQVGGDKQWSALADRMEDAARWFTMPDGHYAPVGDTEWQRSPVADRAVEPGMQAFRNAGYVAVRNADSYLLTQASYHGETHKHQDELSFIWAEQGQPIVSDSGRFGYDYDAIERKYAVSSRAHNTLTIEGKDFPPYRPYGSGILDAKEHDGIYVVAAKNPLLFVGGVSHKRLWIYRPGEWLVVVDDVKAKKAERLVRSFHFWPELSASKQGQGVVAKTEKLAAGATPTTAFLRDLSDAAPKLRIVRGKKTPPVQGFVFREDRKLELADVVELENSATKAKLITLLTTQPELAKPGRITVRCDSACDVSVDSKLVVRAKLENDKLVLEGPGGP